MLEPANIHWSPNTLGLVCQLNIAQAAAVIRATAIRQRNADTLLAGETVHLARKDLRDITGRSHDGTVRAALEAVPELWWVWLGMRWTPTGPLSGMLLASPAGHPDADMARENGFHLLRGGE